MNSGSDKKSQSVKKYAHHLHICTSEICTSNFHVKKIFLAIPCHCSLALGL